MGIFKSYVGIDASQIYLYSMCQAMPTGLYTSSDIDTKISTFTPRQNKIRSFGNIVKSYFPRTRTDCKIKSFYTTGRQKTIDQFSLCGFCSHFSNVFGAIGCIYPFCPCQEFRPSFTAKDIIRGSKKR